MSNYFLDNDDLLFLFDHIDLGALARIQEDEFTRADNGDTDYAPQDAADAVDNYRRIMTIIGQVAGEMVAPNAEQIDREGNALNDDGTVTLHPLVQENLKRLAQADMMGFTLPRKYGGLNCPVLVYTMANEIVSRADTSLMNLFGLQGIAETIYAFANDQIKDETLPLFARGGALRFLLTRLHDWVHTPTDALVTRKNPIEYWDKLRFHQGVKSAGEYGLK